VAAPPAAPGEAASPGTAAELPPPAASAGAGVRVWAVRLRIIGRSTPSAMASSSSAPSARRAVSWTIGRCHRGMVSGARAVLSSWKASLTTLTLSPRAASNPTAFFTSLVMLSICAGVSACSLALPSAATRETLSSSTATLTRLMLPPGWRV
jgi:hypothetical protein